MNVEEGEPSPSRASPPARGWSHLIEEQLEEMGWTAGLLQTMGDRLVRAASPEARELGSELKRHAAGLRRLREGALQRALEVVRDASERWVNDAEWTFVGKALRTCGEAMETAARGYVDGARSLPNLDGELRTVPGEMLIISCLVEERGGQMRTLGDRLLALTEGERIGLSGTRTARKPSVG